MVVLKNSDMLSAILKPHSDEEVWCFPRFYLPHAEPPKQQLVCPPDTHTITNQSLCVLFLTDAFFLSVTRTMSLFLPPLPDNRLKSSISHVLPRHLSRIPSSSHASSSVLLKTNPLITLWELWEGWSTEIILGYHSTFLVLDSDPEAPDGCTIIPRCYLFHRFSLRPEAAAIPVSVLTWIPILGLHGTH
ncbi:uncharacterized protein BT62DRAFT_1071163 [Guyanagaster necrorhizus]|uniref:Uncharacterized protein n=1 Tax=Guyanagaster necrorhizus TaxID=856835 RepID=A0A9P7W4H5_9AGAR|nr:uncharacterized protein BT62DRAFT_1071163 [Guyanagaster necrorhizus MCA 3950]KAG7451964.1 hypothetical protein BT62DRAFT_1071163 [Guyanagaster necrorhizus MCA 3950]